MSKSMDEVRSELRSVKDITEALEIGSADGSSAVNVDSCSLDLLRVRVDEYGTLASAWLDFDGVVALRDLLHEWIIRTNIKGRT